MIRRLSLIGLQAGVRFAARSAFTLRQKWGNAEDQIQHREANRVCHGQPNACFCRVIRNLIETLTLQNRGKWIILKLTSTTGAAGGNFPIIPRRPQETALFDL